MSIRDYQMIDSKLFKAFMAAAEAENFTNAAKLAFMTQSGISQHIAKLEEQLGLPLFKRIGNRVTLTETGKQLQRFIKAQQQLTEGFLDDIQQQHTVISGHVGYAMPASCLLSPHFPMLLERRMAHPSITLSVTLTSTPEVTRMLLEDRIDFGFVTAKSDHPSLDHRLFCQEEYVLVGNDAGMMANIDLESIADYTHIFYADAEVYYDKWLKHHLPHRKNLDHMGLNTSGRISTIEGAIKMVQGGLGISIFPSHCVHEFLEDGSLYAFRSQQHAPLMNDIHIATLKGHEYPRVVRQVLRWFFDMHPCESPDNVARVI